MENYLLKVNSVTKKLTSNRTLNRILKFPLLVPAVAFLSASLIVTSFLLANRNVVNKASNAQSSSGFQNETFVNSDASVPFRTFKRSNESYIGGTKEGSIALCLTGMVRDFELTGPTFKKYFLGYGGYYDAHVFLITPFDDNAHKLSALTGINFVSVRVFEDFNVNETNFPTKYLKGLQNGAQGLLQQFHMEERCIHDIELREKKQKWMYQWVARTRLDGFWVWYPPPLSALNHTSLTVPAGDADFGGINDRFSIGNKRDTWASLSRLPRLWDLRLKRGRGAEGMLKEIVKMSGTKLNKVPLHFCICSRHYGWQMYSLSSTGPLGGYYCRPCTPKTGQEPTAEKVWCDYQNNWEVRWEETFDSVVPPDQSQIRRHITGRSVEQCIQDLEEFKRAAFDNAYRLDPETPLIWEFPPSSAVCIRKRLQSRLRLGAPSDSNRSSWPTFIKSLNGRSQIFVMSISNMSEWRRRIVNARGVHVQFMPAPLELYASNETYESKSRKMEEIKNKKSWKWIPIDLPKLDILVIDIGVLVEDVIEQWDNIGKADPTCTLIINFSYLRSNTHFLHMKHILLQLHLHLDTCLTQDSEYYGRCTFFSSLHCSPTM